MIKTKPIKTNEIMYQKINSSVSEDTEFVTYQCSFKGFYNSYILFDKKWNKINKTAGNINKNVKMKSKSKPRNQNKTIKEIPYEKIEKHKVIVNINDMKKCFYYKNKICIYFNDICNPYSVKCNNPNIIQKNKKLFQKSNSQTYKNEQIKIQHSDLDVSRYVKAIVLSHNKKCVYEEHDLRDINAIIKVLTQSNKIIEIKVPAVYCKECDQFIILKSDYKSIKLKGTLLCVVIDKTPEYILKHKDSSFSGTESKLHRLGYNVIKQGYNYTFEQRKIILANIIENYGITQHEILSMLDTNISRKINLSNYAEAVEKWKQDREYVINFQHGNIPEVIINEILVGER